MNNVMTIEGHKAVVNFDPDIAMLRGEFLGLNGGADFYASDVEGLQREGAISLRTFLEVCAEKGMTPYRRYSGKFVLRIDPDVHEAAALAAAAQGMSLNQWAVATLSEASREANPDRMVR